MYKLITPFMHINLIIHTMCIICIYMSKNLICDWLTDSGGGFETTCTFMICSSDLIVSGGPTLSLWNCHLFPDMWNPFKNFFCYMNIKYYVVNSANICLTCEETVSVCGLKCQPCLLGDKGCEGCPDGLVLQQLTCVPTCDRRFYVKGNACISEYR